ncbi:hypothetical protein DSL72_002770 [Monilinia vaccinii-corymbosi]|uniref:Uncharacterized protein n=1 Tax=Monilinia vaccinii-corymbosi TaxID=61207 RepID=A0A8A3PDN1_9HELO|nr:hypothetical protein DSL72_002770 [Monilinia vaccinii-corymbosi]
MPFCPLSVSELPPTSLEKSPRVVDVKRYQESLPEVHIFRGSLAPLDAAVTCLWMKNPRCLQQFLNRRLPLFIFHTQRTMAKNTRWEITFIRQKVSDCMHLIQLRVEVRKRDERGEWKSFEMMKVHYITDGHILQFECHDIDATRVPNMDIITTAHNATRLGQLSVVEKIHILAASSIMEIECGSLCGAFDPQYFLLCDGKWKKPDDLTICPRMHSRMLNPLLAFWELEYYRSRLMGLEAEDVKHLLDSPLWRRCICQAAAVKFNLGLFEQRSAERKMENLFKIKPYRNTDYNKK